MKKHRFKKLIFWFRLLAASLVLIYPLAKAKAGSATTVKYTSQDLRDPFQSPFEMGVGAIEQPMVSPGLTHLKIQGIVWGSKMPQAIINNAVVGVGEVIAGVEILDIRREGVYVLYEGRQYILRPTIKN